MANINGRGKNQIKATMDFVWNKLTCKQSKLQAEHHDAECLKAVMLDVDAVGRVEVQHHWL